MRRAGVVSLIIATVISGCSGGEAKKAVDGASEQAVSPDASPPEIAVAPSGASQATPPPTTAAQTAAPTPGAPPASTGVAQAPAMPNGVGFQQPPEPELEVVQIQPGMQFESLIHIVPGEAGAPKIAVARGVLRGPTGTLIPFYRTADGKILRVVPRNVAGGVPASSPMPSPRAAPRPLSVTELPIAEPDATIPFPDQVDSYTIGGSGRYLLLSFQALQKVGVFDLRTGTVLKYVNVAASRFSVAGGATQFVVVDHADGKLAAWKYDALEQPRLQASLPVDEFKKIDHAVMGCSADGPLGLVYIYQELEQRSSQLSLQRAFVELVDLATLKPLKYTLDWKGRPPVIYEGQHSEKIVVSPDGKSFTKVKNPSYDTLTFNGTSLTLQPKRPLKVDGITMNPVHMGFDGTIFDRRRILLPEGRIFSLENSGPWLMPTYPGQYWMTSTGAASNAGPTSALEFYLTDYKKPVASLRLPTPQGLTQYYLTANAPWTLHNQVFFNTEEKALVAFLAERRSVLFKRFDVEAEVAKSAENVLKIVSKPPQEFVPGKKLEYVMRALSNRGGVAFRLESGPKGMTVSPEGRLEWTPTADDTANQTAIVGVKDGVGTQVFHNIALARGEVPIPEAAADGKLDPNMPRVAIRLPAPADDFVVGAGGRYWLAVMRSKRQIAVVDVKERRIVKLLSTDDDVVKVAAGATKFVVYSGKGTLSRWSFAKLERELSVPFDAEVESLCMGCASEGPLLLSVKKDRDDCVGEVYELGTLKPSKTKIFSLAYKNDPSIGFHTAASADGRTFVSWHNDAVGFQIRSFVTSGDQLLGYTWLGSAGPVTPSPDGATLYSVLGEFPSRDKDGLTGLPFGTRPKATRIALPAATGSFALAWPAENAGGADRDVTLHVQGNPTPIVTIPGVVPPGLVSITENDPLFSRRLMYVPAADAIVSPSAGLDAVIVHRFALEEALAKTTNDYLFVTSTPPQVIRPSTQVNYRIDVKSKKGDLRYKLVAGPPEAHISPTGVFTWTASSNLDGDHPVQISISDSAGNTTVHAFTLLVDKNADLDRSLASTEFIDVGRPKTVLSLPGPIEGLCVGGAGRYLVGVIPTVKQVAVIDVVGQKILKLIPADDDKVCVAAGGTKFVVSLGAKGVLLRYAFPSCERELTAVVPPPQEIVALRMGCNSEGPVYALHKGSTPRTPTFFDLKNLKPITIDTDNRVYRAYGFDLACSADGGCFASGEVQAQVSGEKMLVVEHKRRDGETRGAALPSADGRVLYGFGGMWKFGGDRIGDDQYKAYNIPAATGPYFARLPANLSRNKKTKPNYPTFHLQGSNQPLFTIDDVEVPKPPNPYRDGGYPIRNYAERFFLLPIYGAICTLDASGVKLNIHRFQLEEELKKATSDYLFVASVPPVRVHPESSLSYQLDVRSKRGDVKFRLDTGPRGMTISPTGLISWTAKGADAAEKIVVVAVSDASEQGLFHTFKFQVDASAPLAPAIGTTLPKPDAAASPKAAETSPAVAVGPAPSAIPTPKPAAADSEPALGARSKHTLKLPAVFDDICVGGGGRFLILKLSTLKQAVVFDVAARKIVKYLSIDDDRFQIAAGNTKLIVALQSKNILARYDLATGDRELEVPFTDKTITTIAMGSSSEGPLFIGSHDRHELTPTFIDLRTLKPTTIGKHRQPGDSRFGNNVRVSADGTLFGSWSTGVSPSGLHLATVHGDAVTYAYEHESVGVILPSPDARVVYTGKGTYAPNGKLLNTSTNRDGTMGVSLPAASGPFYLRLTFGSAAGSSDRVVKNSLTLHMQAEKTPILAIEGIELPKIERDLYDARIAQLKLDRRIFLLPVAGAIAIVAAPGDAVDFYDFRLDEELRRTEVDYLFVASVPPATVAAGSTLRYQIDAKSKRGGIKYRLEAGPAGITVSPEGLVTWPAKGSGETEVAVVIVLGDASGQETFHTFKVRVEPGSSASSPGATSTSSSPKPAATADAKPPELDSKNK